MSVSCVQYAGGRNVGVLMFVLDAARLSFTMLTPWLEHDVRITEHFWGESTSQW